jgi:hypothetical protein
MWWLIPVAIAALLAVALTLSVVFDWFGENVVSDTTHGELIRERLRNGNFRVVAGVFNTRGEVTSAQEWETERIDSDLAGYFGPHDHIRVEV